MRVVGVLAGVVGLLATAACAPPALREPPFVEATGSPITTACIAPSAWNCVYPNVTRREVLESLEVADLARALQKPGNPPAYWDSKATKREQREAAKRELAPRQGLVEEEEALLRLRDYVACHAWDLDQTFELARRNWELNRFASASYLFLRVAENSEDDRAVNAFIRAIESLNVTGNSGVTECYDEMERRVPFQVVRLCAHRDSEECIVLKKIDYDLQRMKMQEVIRAAERRASTDTEPKKFRDLLLLCESVRD